ncbi:hypothetical protein A259_17640, partial [Pseudomonas syringae pv. actinidiae ICMP 19070]
CFFRKNRRGDNYPDTGGAFAGSKVLFVTAGFSEAAIERSCDRVELIFIEHLCTGGGKFGGDARDDNCLFQVIKNEIYKFRVRSAVKCWW